MQENKGYYTGLTSPGWTGSGLYVGEDCYIALDVDVLTAYDADGNDVYSWIDLAPSKNASAAEAFWKQHGGTIKRVGDDAVDSKPTEVVHFAKPVPPFASGATAACGNLNGGGVTDYRDVVTCPACKPLVPDDAPVFRAPQAAPTSPAWGNTTLNVGPDDFGGSDFPDGFESGWDRQMREAQPAAPTWEDTDRDVVQAREAEQRGLGSVPKGCATCMDTGYQPAWPWDDAVYGSIAASVFAHHYDSTKTPEQQRLMRILVTAAGILDGLPAAALDHVLGIEHHPEIGEVYARTKEEVLLAWLSTHVRGQDNSEPFKDLTAQEVGPILRGTAKVLAERSESPPRRELCSCKAAQGLAQAAAEPPAKKMVHVVYMPGVFDSYYAGGGRGVSDPDGAKKYPTREAALEDLDWQTEGQRDKAEIREVEDREPSGECGTCGGGGGASCPECHSTPAPDCLDCGKTPCTCTGGIYVASRASVPERPAMWRTLRDLGHPIISSWIDEAGPGETTSHLDLWRRIRREIQRSDALILYIERSDLPVRGVFVEAGMALALGKRVFVAMPGLTVQEVGSWLWAGGVTLCADVEDALRQANALIAARGIGVPMRTELERTKIPWPDVVESVRRVYGTPTIHARPSMRNGSVVWTMWNGAPLTDRQGNLPIEAPTEQGAWRAAWGQRPLGGTDSPGNTSDVTAEPVWTAPSERTGPRESGLAAAVADVRAFMQQGQPEQLATAPRGPEALVGTDYRRILQEMAQVLKIYAVCLQGSCAAGSPHGDSLSMALLTEALGEIAQAILNGKQVEFLDGLIDLSYFALAAGLRAGFPMAEAWALVHEANMAKYPTCSNCAGEGSSEESIDAGRRVPCPGCEGRGFLVYRNEAGKVVKPPGWTPPDLGDLLRKVTP